MAGWLAAMVVMAVAGRETTRGLHVFQVLELRSLIGLAMLAPLIHASGGLAAMRTRRPLAHVARHSVHFASTFGWFFALTLIPLAHVVAIEFTMPLWTAVLAVVVLGERMDRWKAAALALGLTGVATIVRPDAGSVEPGQLIALVAAVGFSVSVIMVKSLTRTERTVAIVFWMLAVQAVIGAVPALLVWRPVPASLWPWLLVVAFCGAFSHLCMAQAMRHADTTVVVPLDFLRVPLTALAGWLLYAERLDVLTVVGAGLILSANLLNLRRGAVGSEAGRRGIGR